MEKIQIESPHVSVVMPAKIQKPLGVSILELKEFYLKNNFDTDAKIVQAAIDNDLVAFRYNYHKRKSLYYISITFCFMEKENVLKFLEEYSKIVE